MKKGRIIKIDLWVYLDKESQESYEMSDQDVIDEFRVAVRDFEGILTKDPLFTGADHEEHGKTGQWILKEGE